jgi:glycosyltransferase involved in cell wall biosynthesis
VDLRDLVWKYLINLGGFSALVGRLFGFIANYAIARADLVLVTNNSEFDEVCRINANTILLPNGISAEKFELLTTIAAKTQSSSSVTLNLLYAGNIGQAQNIDELVPVIGNVDNVQLKIIGNGTAEKNLQQQLAASNVRHIQHINKLPWSELGEHFQQADVLIIKLSPEYSTAIPSKLYEYLALDKPILIIADGYLHTFAQQFSNTYLLKCDELQNLPAVLEEIRQADKNSIRSSEVVRENYIRDTLNEPLIAALTSRE